MVESLAAGSAGLLLALKDRNVHEEQADLSAVVNSLIERLDNQAGAAPQPIAVPE